MEEIINENVRSETRILLSFVQVLGLGKRYSFAMKFWAAAFNNTIDKPRYLGVRRQLTLQNLRI